MIVKILSGDNIQLAGLLGIDLASKITMIPGHSFIECETEEQVAVGREVFERLLTQGHTAYDRSKEVGEQKVDVWNPTKESEIIIVGFIAGG